MLTEGFRPLAGISCVTEGSAAHEDYKEFPSPRGDKLCPEGTLSSGEASTSIRPLAGISCVCKTAQLEPVRVGLVLSGSLYETPLQPASGSWK